MLLCVLTCFSLSTVALAANTRDITSETVLASKLNALSLFHGTGEFQDETPLFALDQRPNRVEALMMFVRTLGKGVEAENYPKTHPFIDVPAWADGAVSYAYDNGLTKGVSDKQFGSQETASAEMYITFLLRALGYPDQEDADFTWDMPWLLAAYCQILPPQVEDGTDFVRADLVGLTYAALFATKKGSSTTLYEQLIAENVFTQQQFEAAFSQDPFSRYRKIDKKITETIMARGASVHKELNTYATECHLITDVEERGDVLTVSFLVCYDLIYVTGRDYPFMQNPSNDLWQIDLDTSTLDVQACRTSGELSEQNLPLESYFSSDSLVARETMRLKEDIREAMWKVCLMDAQLQVSSGAFVYQKPTD